MSQNVLRKLMRKGSNQQDCRSTIGCYESVGLSTVCRQKISDRSSHRTDFHQTAKHSLYVASYTVYLFDHTFRDGGCAIVESMIREKSIWNSTGEDQWRYTTVTTSKKWMYKSLIKTDRSTDAGKAKLLCFNALPLVPVGFEPLFFRTSYTLCSLSDPELQFQLYTFGRIWLNVKKESLFDKRINIETNEP